VAEEYELADELHLLREHRELGDRLTECERILAEHGLSLSDLGAALAAHADEPVELVEVEVEDSDGAQVDIEQADAEAEPGGAAAADAGEDERESA
jgi:hypothetical protein